MSTPSVTLTSLAMLKVNLDTQERDYLDYLVPFVIHVLSTYRPDPLTDAGVRGLLLTEFRLTLPVRAVQLVLRRLAKRNFLERSHGVYHLKTELPATQIPSRRAEAERHITHVVDSLCIYAKSKFDTTWSSDEATSAVTAFLAHFSIECLRAHTHGTAIPKVSGGPRGLFITCSFIRDAHASNTDLFESVVVFVKGFMLSNALFCPDLESIQLKYGSVTFYLDTPLVLRLLQLQGDEEFAVTTEVVDLVRRLQGTIAIFEHTAEEVHHVIRGCEDHQDDPEATGPIIREMRRLGRTRSDLILLRGRLNDLYGKLHITRMPTPSHDPAFQIDEAILQSAIEDEIDYLNPKALLYDIKSIRSIYTLRRGLAPVRLEDAGAVLVTSNAALAQAAFYFGREHEASREVSSVITDFSLANTAWLKAPLGAPELPARETLAICYGAMAPGENLWARYIQEIDKLKEFGKLTAQDHAMLRHSLHARNELMDLTLGNEAALTAGTISQILERVKKELVKEQEERLHREQTDHAETARERDGFATANQRIEKRIFWQASRWASRVGKGVFWALVAIIAAAGVASTFLTTSFVSHSFLLTAAVNSLGVFALAFGIGNLVCGITARSIANRVEEYLRPRFLLVLRKNILDDVRTPDGAGKGQ